jgi:hypothetical protein
VTADVEFFPDGSFTFPLTPESIKVHGDGQLMDLVSRDACLLEVWSIVREEIL